MRNSTASGGGVMRFESHQDYKKFWEWFDWLDSNWSQRNAQQRCEDKKKLSRGIKMMRQLALSYGKEFIVPKKATEILSKDFSSKITWVDFKIKGIKKVGLWLGANKILDGFYIFNLEWFNEFVMDGRDKKSARAVIKFYIDNDCEIIG